MLETILVPLDGTRRARAALPVAATLRELFRATLHVVHVRPDAPPLREALAELGLSPEELRGAVFSPAVGDPTDEILRLAESHLKSVVVMCPCTGGDPASPRLGSVARALLERVSRPVLLVPGPRGPGPWHPARILLSHDASPGPGDTIRLAAALAQRAAAQLLVLYVEPPVTAAAAPGRLAPPRYVDAPHHDWPVWALEFSQRLYALGHGQGAIDIQPLIAPGRPEDTIASYTACLRPDLVVLGWEGRLASGSGHILQTLVRDGAAPVLAVREAG